MKNSLLLLLCYSFQTALALAQPGQWTWMKGDSVSGSTGIFGIQGVADPLNNPPALYEAINWTDNQGNFWLFGGATFTAPIYYNALWKFDPVTNNWTWMKGPDIPFQPGVYGVQGIPDANNNPGSHAIGGASWTDSTGNLWLFGGLGYDSQDSFGISNDLWKYDIATNEWTWMKGSEFINGGESYGTQGIEAASNEISARSEAVGTWTGKNNYLWYFGGFAFIGAKNDLWRYNIGTNNWTWIKGSQGINTPPSYGTRGIADTSNDPGGRGIYSRWVGCDGNFWFFGGALINPWGDRNDLWKYNPVTNEYTWMNGPTAVGLVGVTGNLCEFDTSFYPAARYESKACWRDAYGNFWFYGGFTAPGLSALSDLWVYIPGENKWSLAGGTTLGNESGFYGQQGVSNAYTRPGGKAGPVSWVDQSGNFWLFGGNKKIPNTLLSMNDMWKYTPDTSCTTPYNVVCNPSQAPGFIASATSVCEKFCLSFFDQTGNNPTAWQWLFPGGNPATSTAQNPSGICYNVSGIYDVTLITTNADGNDTLTLDDYITVNATPPLPTISQAGYVLTSTPAATYQWQLNSIDIPGATNQAYSVLQSGYYTIVIQDSAGCSSQNNVYILISGEPNVEKNQTVTIFPNPTSGDLLVDVIAFAGERSIKISVINILGIPVYAFDNQISSLFHEMKIDLSQFPAGIYLVEVRMGDEVVRKKIVKE